MGNLWRYLNVIVMMMHRVLYFDCADGYLYFRNNFFGGGGVYNCIYHELIYSIVELHGHDDGMYYHPTSRIDFHHPFKDVLNRLALQVVTCSTVT